LWKKFRLRKIKSDGRERKIIYGGRREIKRIVGKERERERWKIVRERNGQREGKRNERER
jgi:hypothetical protein